MFSVTVLNCEKILYEGQAAEATLPTLDGELTILEFHQPIITVLENGSVRIDAAEIPIISGIAKMARNKLVVLCEI